MRALRHLFHPSSRIRASHRRAGTRLFWGLLLGAALLSLQHKTKESGVNSLLPESLLTQQQQGDTVDVSSLQEF